MHFELRINSYPVTRVSVIRKGMASPPPEARSDGGRYPIMPGGPDDGWFVYEWNAWRVDPESPDSGIRYYAAGELIHRYADGVEALAVKVLTEYREAVHPEQELGRQVVARERKK